VVRWYVEHLWELRHSFDPPTHRRALVYQVDQWLCQPARTSGRGVHQVMR
jgi:hypothetical protein